MTSKDFHRKARIAWLHVKISALRIAMSFEVGVTDEWKRMARRQTYLIGQVNQLKILDIQARNEKRRAG